MDRQEIEEIMAQMPRVEGEQKHACSYYGARGWRWDADSLLDAQCRLLAKQGWRKVPSIPVICLCGSTRFTEEMLVKQ